LSYCPSDGHGKEAIIVRAHTLDAEGALGLTGEFARSELRTFAHKADLPHDKATDFDPNRKYR